MQVAQPGNDVMYNVYANPNDTLAFQSASESPTTVYIGFIAVGVSFVIFVILGIVFYFVRRRRASHKAMSVESSIPLPLVSTVPSTVSTVESVPRAPIHAPPISNSLLDQQFPMHTSSSDGDCSICLSSLSSQPVRTLECRHDFHAKCIDEWFMTPQQPILIPLETRQDGWLVKAVWKIECPQCRLNHEHILPIHIVTIQKSQTEPLTPTSQLETLGRPNLNPIPNPARFGPSIPAGGHYSAFSRSPAQPIRTSTRR